MRTFHERRLQAAAPAPLERRLQAAAHLTWTRRRFLRSAAKAGLFLPLAPAIVRAQDLKAYEGAVAEWNAQIPHPATITCTTSGLNRNGDAVLTTFPVGKTGAGECATSFTLASGGTLCSINWWLARVGSPAFGLTSKVYSNGSSQPGSLLATSYGVGASSVGTTAGAVQFSFSSGPTLSASTTYWASIVPSAQGDASDYINANEDNTTGYHSGCVMSGSTGSWATAANYYLMFQVMFP